MGSDGVKLRKGDKVEWGKKWHYASEILFDYFFLHIIFYIVRKWLLIRNLATILPL